MRLGERMRQARLATGMSCEEVAQKLRLPHTVIEALENDQYDEIGYGIYLRSYLSKYLGVLGLPMSLAGDVIQQHSALPPLVTSRAQSRPRYLYDRYSGSALYLILTGVIVVPAVLLAMHANLDRNFTRVASLDKPLSKADLPAASGQSTSVGQKSPAAKIEPSIAAPHLVKPSEQSALAASMAPFNAPNPKPAVAAPAQVPVSAPAPVAPTSDKHDLHLHLTEASWVEVVDSDGQHLEYSLLPAGSERDYRSDKALTILLGNAQGASVSIDGKPQDIDAYLHGNVARFKLAQGDWSISPSGG